MATERKSVILLEKPLKVM